MIHRDLGIETVTDINAKFAKSNEKKTSKPHQHRSVHTSQREQYHQTIKAEEAV
jgi:hypothetical protein